MSAHGAPENSSIDASGLRIGIVAASWHARVMDGLIAGALRAARESGVSEPELIRVPGSFELPVTAQTLAKRCDAVVALGVVIRGGTPHFDYVCQAATIGLTQASLSTETPIGFGVLTCDDERQALDRAGLKPDGEFPGSIEDKGYEATSAALRTAVTLRGIR